MNTIKPSFMMKGKAGRRFQERMHTYEQLQRAQQRQKDLLAMDADLSVLVVAMNQASGTDKATASAAVLTKLVEQHQARNAHIAASLAMRRN